VKEAVRSMVYRFIVAGMAAFALAAEPLRSNVRHEDCFRSMGPDLVTQLSRKFANILQGFSPAQKFF
jgi:hypothetical protein